MPVCTHPDEAPPHLPALLPSFLQAVAVNFVTNDAGSRSGCAVEAEVRLAAGSGGGGNQWLGTFTGDSTRYHDSESSRMLSYHHVTLHTLAERTRYEYRVRVANRTASPKGGNGTAPQQWRETKGIKWCSGSNFDPMDPFGQGFDSGSRWCPLLPAGLAHDARVAACERVCAAPNATACAGFTLYQASTNAGHTGQGVCCFRSNTDSKPADPTGTAECYEKVGGPSRLPCAGQPSAWSDWLGFRSLYAGSASGPTRLALYADMGVYVKQGAYTPPVTKLPAPARHHIGNLVDDLAAGLIDFAIHSGDHAYQFEVSGGARGDGYMDSYSAFLAHAPWAPGWGNHEYLEGDRGNRLAAIAHGAVAERARARPGTTRMWYSVEVGMLHVLHLDLSPYWCRFKGCVAVDTCGVPDEWVADASSDDPDVRYNFTGYRAAAMAFAAADLAAVDREQTPWVIVTAYVRPHTRACARTHMHT